MGCAYICFRDVILKQNFLFYLTSVVENKVDKNNCYFLPDPVY